MIIDTVRLRSALSAEEQAECKRLDAIKSDNVADRCYTMAERNSIDRHRLISKIEDLATWLLKEAGG